MKDKILLELIVVLLLVGFALWSLTKDSAPVANNGTNINQTNSANNNLGGNINANTPATISYSQALKTYKDARIQLDKDCRATPTSATYKNGASIMIDNRSDVARTIKVGSTFSIPAYGFKIVQLSSVSLPATWFVDCGNSQNVATILIQK